MQLGSSSLIKLQSAESVVFLTGAGMSADSGIPTFRDKGTGLWERFSVEDLATPEAFRRNPDLVWSWYQWRRMEVLRAEPNAGHRAIAELAASRPGVKVVTQNVDDLHERAGAQQIMHLHGSLFAPRCFACGRPYTRPLDDDFEAARKGRLKTRPCGHCGGRVRPGVVWFGEELPQSAWHAAHAAVEKADALVVVGTSAQVYPVAALPKLAKQRGAVLVQVNPEPTPIDGMCDLNLQGPAALELPRLIDLLRGGVERGE
jgi:NAD-dependent deacetylase